MLNIFFLGVLDVHVHVIVHMYLSGHLSDSIGIPAQLTQVRADCTFKKSLKKEGVDHK